MDVAACISELATGMATEDLRTSCPRIDVRLFTEAEDSEDGRWFCVRRPTWDRVAIETRPCTPSAWFQATALSEVLDLLLFRDDPVDDFCVAHLAGVVGTFPMFQRTVHSVDLAKECIRRWLDILQHVRVVQRPFSECPSVLKTI
jgi:hypothetical protein